MLVVGSHERDPDGLTFGRGSGDGDGCAGLHGFGAGGRLAGGGRLRAGGGRGTGGGDAADGGSVSMDGDTGHDMLDPLVEGPADQRELHIGREADADEMVAELGTGGGLLAAYLFERE